MSKKIIEQYLAAKRSGERPLSPRVPLGRALCDWLPAQDFEYTIRDTAVPNLHIRVRPSGHRALEVMKKVHGRTARGKVCTLGELAFKAAKGVPETVHIRARALLAEMDAGVTPTKKRAAKLLEATEAKAKATTVEEACDAYIDAKDRATNTTAGYERIRDGHLSDWADKQLAGITPDEVIELHRSITEKAGAVAANNTFRFFRAVWRAQRRKLKLDESPTYILSRNEADDPYSWAPEVRRSRYVHTTELRAWWEATQKLRTDYRGDGELAADYLQFAILSGMRRREISGLEWQDINFRRKTLVLTDNKSHRELVLPLTKPMLKILEGRKKERRPFDVVEPKKFIAQVCKWSGVDFSVHDLRRTVATHATDAGVPMPVLKAILNHSPERKLASGDVTEGYIQVSDEQKRKSLTIFQNYILTHAGVVSNVVHMEAANG